MSKFQEATFARTLVKQAWPEPDTDLLIKATSLPAARARQHWKEWLNCNDIDECTWPQFKLLVRLSGRLREIDPDCSEIPRLNGMAKALWTKSQLQLNAAATCIDTLSRAGVDVYLMKTAAFEAVDSTMLTRRVTSDLDFMVRRSELPKALELLFQQGWKGPRSAREALERCRRNPGVNLRRSDPNSNIEADADIHHQPIHMPYLPDQIVEKLWHTAVRSRFRGRNVLAPLPEELAVITAIQGTRRFIPSHLSSGMWPMDLVELLRKEGFSISLMLEIAEELSGNWPLLCCLTYLEDELEYELPDGLTRQLAKRCSSWSGALHFYAQAPSSGRLKYLNLPLRELALIACQHRFRSRGRKNDSNAI